MATQVAFTVDESLKDQTMKLCKQKGIPLKSFLSYCMQAFVDGDIDLGIKSLSPQEEDDRDVQYTEKNHKARLEARKDLEEGKNITPLLEYAKERGITV